MANTPTISPLSGEDLGRINTALSNVDKGLAQAELAQRAGIDVSGQIQQLKDTQAKLLQIKQVYFPGQ